MILIILLGTLRERMRLITQIDNLYFFFFRSKNKEINYYNLFKFLRNYLQI